MSFFKKVFYYGIKPNKLLIFNNSSLSLNCMIMSIKCSLEPILVIEKPLFGVKSNFQLSTILNRTASANTSPSEPSVKT
jgi:hypothetical protein